MTLPAYIIPALAAYRARYGYTRTIRLCSCGSEAVCGGNVCEPCADAIPF